MEELPRHWGAFGNPPAAERRLIGRFGGVLMMVGSAMAIPAGLMLDPMPTGWEFGVWAVGFVVGAVIFMVPWERASGAWIHVGLTLGILESVIAVATISDDYAFYLVLASSFVAFTMRDPRVLTGYAVVIGLAVLAPITYADESLREQMHHILIALPIIVIAGGAVVYLRNTIEQRERQYQGFAEETASLAKRIRNNSP